MAFWDAVEWLGVDGGLVLDDRPENVVTEQIIGAAIEIHKELGPALLESAYEQCLCYELSRQELQFRRQVELPVRYKSVRLDCGYRIDVLVEDLVIVELKAVEAVLPPRSRRRGRAADWLTEQHAAALDLARQDALHREIDTYSLLAVWGRRSGLGLPNDWPIDRALDAFWRTWVGVLDPIEGAVDALAELKRRGYSLGLVSNVAAPERYAGPFFHLFTGYTLIGAFFLATDDASSPVNVIPMLIYGAVGGMMTVLIRNIGAYVDGVFLAILVVNLLNPLLDKIRPKAIGKVV